MSDTEEEENIRRTIKITLVGEPSTGKSSICSRYTGGSGGPCGVGGVGGAGGAAGAGSTAGAALMAAQSAALRPPAPLQLCDVAGNALASPMLPNYLYASDIVIFVYDLTNLHSFEKLSTWITTVKDIFDKEVKKPLFALFGNKSDLEHQRAVRLSCVQKFASEHLLENYKGSARTGEMVNTAFTNLIARVLGVKVPPDVAFHKKSPVNHVMELENGVIEKYTENVRFCIICNYLGKIIPALQSRCTRFRFAPLQHAQIVPRVQDIAQREGVTISEDGMKALLTLSGGDMRKVLNTLQSTWLAHRAVTEDSVYTCVGHPLRADINYILNCLLNEADFATCFKQIQDLKIAKGLALGDILTDIHTIIQRVKFPPDVLISLLIKMADSEARLASGCSERVELAALIAAFAIARDQVNVDALTV